ncbi:MAG: PAS domain-containing protein [Desulfovibrionaceae bacterium]|jgi:PAS domain S-box-containing protein|nr:PAS domain-containing protein [Desulfovibrionaceae bacterium]
MAEPILPLAGALGGARADAEPELPELPDLTEIIDVADALNDVVLFTDARGTVVHATPNAARRLPGRAAHGAHGGGASVLGAPFWELLDLECPEWSGPTSDAHAPDGPDPGRATLAAILAAYAPARAHRISSARDAATFRLRILPLPRDLAPAGGCAVVVTDLAPLEEIHDEFRERVQDNRAALQDTAALFAALFETAPSAFLLTDEDLVILAANPRAAALFAPKGGALAGQDCRRIVAPGSVGPFEAGLSRAAREPWTGRIGACTAQGQEFPAEFTLRRVFLSRQAVHQVIVRDLSRQRDLEAGLKRRTAEVESMSLTLRRVISSVEEEKQGIKDDLVQQVKERVLPAVERLTESTTPELRRGYRTVIRDQLADMAEDASAESIDPVLLRLTPREMEICHAVRQGLRGREIAERLDIAFETLQTHRKNIRRKLGLRGRNVSLATFLASTPRLPG